MYNDQQQVSNYPTSNAAQPYGQGFTQPPQSPPIAPLPPPSPLQAPAPVAPQQPQPQPVPIPQAANEAEMDKAWVDRAVVLLDKTREDPFLQSHEIARLKAQYMQTRFEKEIKIAQEQK